MYAIRWTRCTGETGTFAQEFSKEYEAQQAARALSNIDAAKGQKGSYKYDVIEN